MIALKFHRAVAADALVAVALMRIIECVDAQVEDAIRQISVREYALVDRPLLKLRLPILRGDEMVVVQVALAHAEKV